MLNMESRSVRNTLSQSSLFILTKVESRVMPALFTRMSTVPNSASTRSAQWAHESKLETSAS